MDNNAKGLPTFARHLRVIVNENFGGRTPPMGDRSKFVLHTNENFGQPGLIESLNWCDSLEHQLNQRTANGTNGRSWCSTINMYPSYSLLTQTQDELLKRGIVLRVHAFRNEDGTFPVWLAYADAFVGQEC